MPLTVTGFLADPAGFGRTVAQIGRRSAARRLRVVGEQALLLGQNYASELGPSRSGNRRRDKGVSFRNGFEVKYTGVDDFAAGIMEVSVRNRSRHARVLEKGAGGHDIPVGPRGISVWPIPYNAPGPIAVVAHKTIKHPGFTGHHILERAARDSMRQSFVGQQLGHADINIRVGR